MSLQQLRASSQASDVGVLLLETQSPSAASSVLFSSVLAPDAMYRVSWRLLQNTSSGSIALRFNADSGSNYRWAAIHGSDAATTNNLGSTSDTAGRIVGNPQVSGNGAHGEFSFTTLPGSPTHVYWTGTTSTFTSRVESDHCSGRYVGGASLSSLTILTSAGTITGTIKLYEVR